tara:strand:- start:160 stop:477 length:318 start_codon:yes stop_codon:yes gene_type:complete
MGKIENLTNNRGKGLLKSNETNKKKGMLTFVKSAYSKGDVVHNDIITEMINTGFYNEIYDKYILDVNVNIEDIPYKVVSIFEMVDYCEPTDLDKHYKGLNIQKLF